MKHRALPKYCASFTDRHGKQRVTFRRKGQTTYYFQAKPWTSAFKEEYQACLDKVEPPRADLGANRTKPGTLNALIVKYCSSAEYRGLKESTRKGYRSTLERLRIEHGDKPVALIERKHVRALVDARAATPAAANNMLDRLRTLFRLAIELEWRHDDPTLSVRNLKERTVGFHAWTDEEIAQFEQRFPIGTNARLAFALLLHTGQRRSDVVCMGWQHVRNSRIRVTQQKTGADLELPIHPELDRILRETPLDNMTFLLTKFGKPFTSAGFGNWFRDRCNEAGLPHCAAHGLRKAAARRLAEAGCTTLEIAAITGHRTLQEVARYTASADQIRLAKQAMGRLGGANQEQILSNLAERVDNTTSNSLKIKG